MRNQDWNAKCVEFANLNTHWIEALRNSCIVQSEVGSKPHHHRQSVGIPWAAIAIPEYGSPLEGSSHWKGLVQSQLHEPLDGAIGRSEIGSSLGGNKLSNRIV